MIERFGQSNTNKSVVPTQGELGKLNFFAHTFH